ncbi:hypothetical protein STAS_35562 [Striga asiatica]|uniref:Uncharacterized protein n=1 Tax=Striga asiatica TaxID=4170 RepID=A0A5A7RKG9_STRAF|nr:hypothetical protein STAS_35562 [Striga asiatica]
MGCAASKLDETPAVALCRDRRAFLDEAIRHRFAFAEAHAAYLESLRAVGLSLDRFFDLDSNPAAARGLASPVLNLPPRGTGKKPPGSPPVETHHHLHSRFDSGSHLVFDDSDSDGDGFHPPDEPVRRFTNVRYMKNQTTPSALHNHRPASPETILVRQSSAYADNPNYNLQENGHGSYSSAMAVSSSSKAPPPPPSPPRSSAWDFLNPFGTFEDDYSGYKPGPDSSRAAREEEGIPDLEDENGEVVKEVHSGRSLVGGEKGGYFNEGQVANGEDFENVGFKSETDGQDELKVKDRVDFKGDLDVLKEIRVEFDRASECGSELAKFLEVGKLQYKWKRKVPFKMLNSLWNLMPKTKRSGDGDPTLLGVVHDVYLKSKNLSSTLHKLYLWETKLYIEVKAEEKMRVLHERKSRKMNRMDHNGAESHKIEAAKTLLRSLSRNIKMAIQVVDKISVKINTLRDEELWPQLNDLIQGLTKMWKSMLECHRKQCRAIGKAKQLDSTIAVGKNSSELEHNLVCWTLEFSHWVEAQKGFARSLNSWLTKCLLYVPEQITDGPRILVISHHWSKMLDRISEKEALDSMCGKIKRLKKEDGEIQKEMIIKSLSLQNVLEAMEAFSGSSLRVYEELLNG